MASIVEFRIPADQVALGQTIEEASELHIEIDRFVDRNTDSSLPFAWVDTDDIEVFEQTVDEDPSVESFAMVAEVGHDYLYRLQWDENVKDVLDVLLTEDAILRSATTNASSDAWEFQLMYAEHDDLSNMYTNCEQKGISLTVDAIYKLDSNKGSEDGLSETQHTGPFGGQRDGLLRNPASCFPE